jgi:hypothetical protein
MKWIWVFLIVIGLANGAINAGWFAGYIMGVIKFAANFTPTPNYSEPAPAPTVEPEPPKPEMQPARYRERRL